jgi:hypothetical protein
MAITINDPGILYHDNTQSYSLNRFKRAIFGYGATGTFQSITNQVNINGGVSTDTTGVGTARGSLAAAGYGGDKAIFGYGETGFLQNITNLVSNTGSVSGDITGVGTARSGLAAAGFGS